LAFFQPKKCRNRASQNLIVSYYSIHCLRFESMNRWIKIILPTILSAVVIALLLIISGLGTISLIDINNDVVTKTVVALDVNTFAVVMIAGVALTVLLTGVLVNITEKPSQEQPQIQATQTQP